jgi:exodeoxyribonuclease VII small subunit
MIFYLGKFIHQKITKYELRQDVDKKEGNMAKKDFEGTFNKLEKIVQGLEAGDLGLDESIKKFEEGISLYKDCKGYLQNAETKIQVLTDSLKEEEYSQE